jgi:1-aminocyclopropane-1-carboxylate deaminase/D-cysteine desulfhydrase-like pyridoxal-dependent ACC family enzyme
LNIPSIRLANWPTPLDSIPHPQLGRLLIKRDDLAGFGFEGRSGVKARKLEGLLAYLKASRTSCFIMPLGNITSLAFDLARAAETLAIDVRYFIVDNPPLPLAQRRSIFARIASNLKLVGPSYSAAATRLLGALIASWPTGI